MPQGSALAPENDPRAVQLVPERHTLANSPELLIRLARKGAGVAAVSDFFAEPYVARGELVPVLRDWGAPDSPAWAVFPGRRLMPAKTRAFIDMLSASMSTCANVLSATAAATGSPPNRFRVD